MLYIEFAIQICYGRVCKYDWSVIGVNRSRSTFSELQLEIVQRESEWRMKARLQEYIGVVRDAATRESDHG